MKPPNTISLDAVQNEPVPLAFELSYSLRELDREPLLEISPVHLEGEITRIEKGYALQARLDYWGKLECSRCLVPYPFQTREDFSLVLTRRPPAVGEGGPLESEDLDTYFYDDPLVPVAPIAEERIQMAVPMKPLCREDCRGLCPRCGADWNVSDCDCTLDFVDPRWEALKSLKKV